MSIQKWKSKYAFDLTNKTYVITGATGGLGKQVCNHLLSLNANIIMACRNMQKASEIKTSFLLQYPNAKIDCIKLDTSSFESANKFAKILQQKYSNGINGFINNAGAFKLPAQTTKQGFEIHFQTNFLVPFYLTTKLLPYFNKNENTKVINVSSISYKWVKIDFSHPDGQNIKSRIDVYGNSKRWLTLCSIALNQQIKHKFPNVNICLVHPGVSATNIIHYKNGGFSKFFYYAVNPLMKTFFTSPKKASLNVIYPIFHTLKDNQWVGPRGLYSVWGYPKVKNIKTNDAIKQEMDKAYKTYTKMIDKIK